MATAPFHVAVGTSAGPLSGTAIPNLQGIEIKALAANTDKIYVGISGSVTASDGFELSAGEALLVPPSLAAKASNIYLIAASGTQGACAAVY